jgi:hypothetical protein
MDAINALLSRLAAAGWKERDAIKVELLAACQALGDLSAVEDCLNAAKKGMSLELRWEVDEIIETLQPAPEADPEPEPEDPNRPLTSADLTVVFDDPRGLMLHKSKVGDRWFATQRDPRSGQPQTFELQPAEITQLKTQLAGSPYWVLGSGGVG